MSIKARVGVDTAYTHQTAAPVTVAPAAVATMPSGATHALASPTAIKPPVTIAAISADRRVLTASAPVAAAAGVEGDLGVAFFQVPESTWVSVRVIEVDGASIRLADALPSTQSMTSGGSLVWAGWVITIPGATVAASAVRNVAIRITQTYNEGADAPARSHIDEVYCDVVRAPWSTGCTSHDVIATLPRLASAINPGELRFSSAIRLAGERLEMRINADLLEASAYADDIIAPSRGPFTLVHACMAAIDCLPADDIDREMLLTRVWGPADADGRRLGGGMYDYAMRRIQIDTDRDGVPDEAETQHSGPRASSVGGTFALRSNPFEMRGGAH